MSVDQWLDGARDDRRPPVRTPFLFDIGPDRKSFAAQIDAAGWIVKTPQCIEVVTLHVVEALLDEVDRMRARLAALEGGAA